MQARAEPMVDVAQPEPSAPALNGVSGGSEPHVEDKVQGRPSVSQEDVAVKEEHDNWLAEETVEESELNPENSLMAKAAGYVHTFF
jgi:hypothetical protein